MQESVFLKGKICLIGNRSRGHCEEAVRPTKQSQVSRKGKTFFWDLKTGIASSQKALLAMTGRERLL
jgi:hypothetical protein